MKLIAKLEFRDYADVRELLRLFYSINLHKYKFEVNERQVEFVMEYEGDLPEGMIKVLSKATIKTFRDIHNPPCFEDYKEEQSIELSKSSSDKTSTEIKEKVLSSDQTSTEIKEKVSSSDQTSTEIKEKVSSSDQTSTEIKEKVLSSDQASAEIKEKESSSDQASTEFETEESIETSKKMKSILGRKAIVCDVIDILSETEFKFNKCRLKVLDLYEKGESFEDDLDNLSRMADVGVYENLFKNVVICSFLVNKIKWAEIYRKLKERNIYYNKTQIQKIVTRVNASGICHDFSFIGFLKEIRKTAEMSFERNTKLIQSEENFNPSISDSCVVKEVDIGNEESIFAEYINVIKGLSEKDKIDFLIKKIDENNSQKLIDNGYLGIITAISYEAVKIEVLAEISDVLSNCGYSEKKWREYRVAYSAFIIKFLEKKGKKLKLIDFLKELRKIVRVSK